MTETYDGYFNLTEADGISGDDFNRHYRESRLGYAEPSADWADCNQEIRCIHPGQHVTDCRTLTGRIHYHNVPNTFLGLPVYVAEHFIETQPEAIRGLPEIDPETGLNHEFLDWLPSER